MNARPEANDHHRPFGKEAVKNALVKATTELIVEQGLSMSVREIASRAEVNHGLVHTYFGSKQALLAAAFDEINDRAAAELDSRGFLPPDAKARPTLELAVALARVILDAPGDPFSSHPIWDSWSKALAAERPELSQDEINDRVIIASTIRLGSALFSDHLASVMGLSEERSAEVNAKVASLVSEIGGM